MHEHPEVGRSSFLQRQNWSQIVSKMQMLVSKAMRHQCLMTQNCRGASSFQHQNIFRSEQAHVKTVFDFSGLILCGGHFRELWVRHKTRNLIWGPLVHSFYRREIGKSTKPKRRFSRLRVVSLVSREQSPLWQLHSTPTKIETQRSPTEKNLTQ